MKQQAQIDAAYILTFSNGIQILEHHIDLFSIT